MIIIHGLIYVTSTPFCGFFWGLAVWKLRLRPLRFFYVQLKVSQTNLLIYVVLWDPRVHTAPGNKWNESGFRPPFCTYRLNWARRTSWGWWDDWDDTALQTQDSKFEPRRCEAEHPTSRSRRLPTILTFTRGWGRNIFVSFKSPRPGTEPGTLAWRAAVLTTTLGPPPYSTWKSQAVTHPIMNRARRYLASAIEHKPLSERRIPYIPCFN